MSDASAIEAASRRLSAALDALEAAAERRRQSDHGEDKLAAQVQALGTDRSKLAAEEARTWLKGGASRPVFLIGGLAGKTRQAKEEAAIARGLGYHAGMLSLGAMQGASVDELVAHCAAVAGEVPLVGFYLQTALGGIALPAEFWRRFC